MLQKINKYLNFLTLFLIICLSIYVLYFNQKFGYINSSEVFNQYKGKIEIEKRLTQSKNMNKVFFDSLQLELKFLQQDIEKGNGDKEILQQKYGKYSMMYQQYEQAQQEEIDKYDAQIWGQINQYVKEYGEKKKYKYIYGMNGNGSFMYSNEGDNITKDVIKYINEKYEGK